MVSKKADRSVLKEWAKGVLPMGTVAFGGKSRRKASSRRPEWSWPELKLRVSQPKPLSVCVGAACLP